MVNSLRALRHRNYRIFISGQGLALIGTWCQRVAIAWLVYRTTGSALLLGVAAFAGEICLLLIAPFGGLIADRVQRVRALIIVESLSAAQALTLAALVWLDWVSFGGIVALSLLLGAYRPKYTDYRAQLQKRAGLEDKTMDYLAAYKYGADLIRKLATMKQFARFGQNSKGCVQRGHSLIHDNIFDNKTVPKHSETAQKFPLRPYLLR